ncbi:MAG: hypothetical protein SFU86_08930 [Pirellulaceae bacterium]|nr:hypothetical protein [Pirellulaceae bacterium]
MFALSANATDDDIREAVVKWFCIVASGATKEAEDFLDGNDSAGSMSVWDFVSRASALTSGGMVSAPTPINLDSEWDDFPIDGPTDIVCRWMPGPKTTEKHPGFIADVLFTIPVNGQWSQIHASFFVRSNDGRLTLQLRDVIQLTEND